MIRLELPFPVSTNHYYRISGRQLRISREGKAFANQLWWMVRQQQPRLKMFEGPLRIHVDLFPPDLKRRDLDNYSGKALYDALQRAQVFKDDRQIRQSVNAWHEPVDDPHCIVTLERL